MRRFFFLLFPVVLVLVFYSACHGLFSSGKANYIFLITLDTTRADAIDYRTANNKITPNLARLAAEGCYFENAYSVIPITFPSHAAMFYSQPPHRLKVYNNGHVANVPFPSLAQLLKNNGYDTAAAISLGVLKGEFGLNKGFDQYAENFKPYLWERRADAVNDDVLAMLKKNSRSKKSFYWIHYSDPHEPYFPPTAEEEFSIRLNNQMVFSCKSIDYASINSEIRLEPGANTLILETVIPEAFKSYPDCRVSYFKYREFSLKAPNVEMIPPSHWTFKEERDSIDYYSSLARSELSVINKNKTAVTVPLQFLYGMYVDEAVRKQFYQEEVSYMDAQLGQLLDYLKTAGIYEKSVFIIMGDHGEGLGEYQGHYGHIHYLNKIYTHVPFIAAGPGIPRSGKRSETVSNLTIAPTILDLAGIPKPASMQGHTLLKPLPTNRILQETYSPEAYFDAFAMVEYPWQVIFYPGKGDGTLEFYNVDRDPFGTVDLNNATHTSADSSAGTSANTPTPVTAADKKIKSDLFNSILKISRIITATKGKIGKSSGRHREILKTLGYL